jgi:hypothetical protein
MAGIHQRQGAGDLDRYMRIAMDRDADRNVRLAAEAAASAILNGAPETLVHREAIEILLEEHEMQAIEALNDLFAGRSRYN